MKISSIVAAALLSGASAAPLDDRTVLESDALTVKGALNLGFYIAKNGYPNEQKCSAKNTAVRREWYVPFGRSTQAYFG